MAVIGINLAMFPTVMIAGLKGDSLALQADALDFLGDSATYAISLWVIGRPLSHRALAANVISALLLLRYRNGDANVRSV